VVVDSGIRFQAAAFIGDKANSCRMRRFFVDLGISYINYIMPVQVERLYDLFYAFRMRLRV